jgi:hypothetical protein
MEPSDKKSCTHKDLTHAHGAQVCEEDKCMICNEGKWEDAMEMFPPTKSGVNTPP